MYAYLRRVRCRDAHGYCSLVGGVARANTTALSSLNWRRVSASMTATDFSSASSFRASCALGELGQMASLARVGCRTRWCSILDFARAAQAWQPVAIFKITFCDLKAASH